MPWDIIFHFDLHFKFKVFLKSYSLTCALQIVWFLFLFNVSVFIIRCTHYTFILITLLFYCLLCWQKGDGKYPAHYSCEDFDASKTGLDYNHSHFLLVDNGTSGKYGTEIKLRSRVESEFATYDIESKKRAVKGL